MDEPFTERNEPEDPADEKARMAALLPRGQCSGCGKPVVFAYRPNGSKMPLDPLAQVYLVTRRNGAPFATSFKEFKGKTVSVQVKKDDGTVETFPIDGLLAFMVTHFATCPKARQFSGKNAENFPRK